MPTPKSTRFRFKKNIRLGFSNNKVIEVKKFRFTSRNDNHRHIWRKDKKFTSTNGRNPHKHKVFLRSKTTSTDGKRPHRHRLLNVK